MLQTTSTVSLFILIFFQEWIWPLGYYLRARLYFAKVLDKRMPGVLKSTVDYIKSKLTRHHEDCTNSQWNSLPELTNSNGKVVKITTEHLFKIALCICPSLKWSLTDPYTFAPNVTVSITVFLDK